MTMTTNANNDPYVDILKEILVDVTELRQQIDANALQRLQIYQDNFPDGLYTESALNLCHYLAMRQYDLRHLQDRLAQSALTSLGRAEASVLSTFDILIDILQRSTDDAYLPSQKNSDAHSFNRGQLLLKQHTKDLFGSSQGQGKAHVMVTLSTEAARDYELIKALFEKGMTCARINCAHDNIEVWASMINNIRLAEQEIGQACRVLMDLAGHKIRTGDIMPGPAVHHIRVKKDSTGKVISPAYLILTTDSQSAPADNALFRVSVPKEVTQYFMPGQLLGFVDNQKKSRALKVEKRLSDHDWLVSSDKSAYLVPSSNLSIIKKHKNKKHSVEANFQLGEFIGEPLEIRLFKDQLLLLTTEDVLGKPAIYKGEALISPAQIGCTLSSAIGQLKVGQLVWIDDGKLGAIVQQISEQGALLQVTVAKPSGVRIQSDKGINFPEATLELSPLTDKDLSDLDFVCAHADLVGFSFVENLAGMDYLMKELAKRNSSRLPIIAKIETNLAVKNLPEIILGTIGRHHLGIMIARGDLAVELGSARLAEIQEELLWLCEAAHVPVIWATQVLESIAKKGTRSRPEFTDAAMAVRAECVMLNKGPYIVDAIDALVNVMLRMHEHQRKKFSRLRALHW